MTSRREVAAITRQEQRHTPVDHFFRTLAESQRARAVCVVLSGTGADGSLGIRAIDSICLCVSGAVTSRTRIGNGISLLIFAGIVIARKGSGLHKAFTVRRISYGEGVERVFPLYSPRVAKIEVLKQGSVRRARLHYLRGRKGKEAMNVRELFRQGGKDVVSGAAPEA